jgi:hypothetical protein
MNRHTARARHRHVELALVAKLDELVLLPAAEPAAPTAVAPAVVL